MTDKPTPAPRAKVKEPSLPLPHERDQATGQVNPKPDDVMEQAKRDLDAGQVDTDLHGTPGLDAGQRDKLMQETRENRK